MAALVLVVVKKRLCRRHFLMYHGVIHYYARRLHPGATLFFLTRSGRRGPTPLSLHNQKPKNGKKRKNYDTRYPDKVA
jgi:hypothetical protein